MESESTQYHSLPLSSSSIIPLAFHKIQKSFSYGVSNYSPKKFRKLLELLTSEKNLLYPNGPILLTFDDGYSHLTDLLPDLMSEFNFQPLLFIPTAYIGLDNKWDYSYLLRKESHFTKEEIKKLSDLGAIIGSHAVSHRAFTSLSQSVLTSELSQSRQILQDICEQPIDNISYPFGRYNQLITEAVQNAGYESAFSMKFPSVKDSALTRGRIPVYSFESVNELINKISRGRSGPGYIAIASLISFLSRGTTLYQKITGSVRQND